MTLRLYADECVDARIVAGLRRREIDVISAKDERLLGAPDEVQMAHAAELGRAILTADDDFLALAHRLANEGRPHPGVVFLLPHTHVGDAVRAITWLADVLEQREIENWIEWVP